MVKMKAKTTKSKCFLHESSIFQITQCLIKELLKWKGRNDKCIIINKTLSFIHINKQKKCFFVCAHTMECRNKHWNGIIF